MNQWINLHLTTLSIYFLVFTDFDAPLKSKDKTFYRQNLSSLFDNLFKYITTITHNKNFDEVQVNLNYSFSPKLENESYSEVESFFVITTIFNPLQYQSRYDLYNKFQKHMADTGTQLVTIECIFPQLGQHAFKVTNSTNPYHLQIKSNSVFWVKENLINIAVSRLPPRAKWIAWIDADVEFENNWVNLTIQTLKKYSVVQVFESCQFLGPNSEQLRLDYSFGYSIVHKKPIDQKRYNEWYPHPGYAWAMSVTAFKQIQGLPEYDILGSADVQFAFSLINKTTNLVEKPLTSEFKKILRNKSYLTFTKLAQINHKSRNTVSIGYVPLNIKHYWHGSRSDRQYRSRWKILLNHNFDIEKDMIRNEDGLLAFKPGREDLQKDILDFFQKRKEDVNIVKEEIPRVQLQN